MHPTRPQIFAGKSDSTFYNIWDIHPSWTSHFLFLLSLAHCCAIFLCYLGNYLYNHTTAFHIMTKSSQEPVFTHTKAYATRGHQMQVGNKWLVVLDMFSKRGGKHNSLDVTNILTFSPGTVPVQTWGCVPVERSWPVPDDQYVRLKHLNCFQWQPDSIPGCIRFYHAPFTRTEQLSGPFWGKEKRTRPWLQVPSPLSPLSPLSSLSSITYPLLLLIFSSYRWLCPWLALGRLWRKSGQL